MQHHSEMQMLTFYPSLFYLFEAGKISYEDALRNADSVNDLRLQIKLHSKEAKNRDITAGIEHLNIVCRGRRRCGGTHEYETVVAGEPGGLRSGGGGGTWHPR